MHDWGNLTKAEIFAENVRRLAERRRLSDQRLYQLTNVAAHTIWNIRNNKIRKPQRTTIKRIEDYFGDKLTDEILDPKQFDSERDGSVSLYGDYTAPEYSHLMGEYFFFKRSFDYPDGLICSHVSIFEDRSKKHLKFKEKQRTKSRSGKKYKYDFSGVVSIPKKYEVVYLIHRLNGLRRIYTLKALQTDDTMILSGLLQTLSQDHRGYWPATTPVYALKASEKVSEAEFNLRVGSFQLDDVWDESVVSRLRELQRDYFPSLEAIVD